VCLISNSHDVSFPKVMEAGLNHVPGRVSIGGFLSGSRSGRLLSCGSLGVMSMKVVDTMVG